MNSRSAWRLGSALFFALSAGTATTPAGADEPDEQVRTTTHYGGTGDGLARAVAYQDGPAPNVPPAPVAPPAELPAAPAPAAPAELPPAPPTPAESAVAPNYGYGAAPAAEAPPAASAVPSVPQPPAELAPDSAEEKDVRWLEKALGMQDSPIKIFGWIQNSITGNANGNGASQVNFGVAPNSLAGQWMGNQYYVVLAKPLSGEADKFDWGFRVDNLFGNDWAFTKMYGLYDNAFVPGRFAGYDTPQFYADFHLPVFFEGGIDVKVGRWYALCGYEVVPAPDRPMISVPYMFNYGQPFTHMGVLTTVNLTDKIKIYNAVTNGNDRFLNTNYDPNYMGGFSWTSDDDATSANFVALAGHNQFPKFFPLNTPIYPFGVTPPTPGLAGRVNPFYDESNYLMFTFVLSHKWTDQLTQVVETDSAWENNIVGLGKGGGPGYAQWHSFGNWFFYDFTDKVQGIWRSEVFWDPDGARVVFGTPDRYYETALSVRWKPSEYLWIQPEVRYDWSQYTTPYANGTKDNQFTYGIQAIVNF